VRCRVLRAKVHRVISDFGHWINPAS